MSNKNDLYKYAVAFTETNDLFIDELRAVFHGKFFYWYVAKLSGLSRQCVSSFLRGTTQPRIDTLLGMANAYIALSEKPIPLEHPARIDSKRYILEPEKYKK